MSGGQTGGSDEGSTNLGVIVTASLAGLLFGFDTVVISGVTESVGKVFHLEAGSFWYGFAVASALLGTSSARCSPVSRRSSVRAIR